MRAWVCVRVRGSEIAVKVTSYLWNIRNKLHHLAYSGVSNLGRRIVLCQ